MTNNQMDLNGALAVYQEIVRLKKEKQKDNLSSIGEEYLERLERLGEFIDESAKFGKKMLPLLENTIAKEF